MALLGEMQSPGCQPSLSFIPQLLFQKAQLSAMESDISKQLGV